MNLLTNRLISICKENDKNKWKRERLNCSFGYL